MKRVFLFACLCLAHPCRGADSNAVPLNFGTPKGIAFSKNGRFLAVINERDELNVVDPRTGDAVRPLLDLRREFGHVFGRNNFFWKPKGGWEWWEIDENLEISDDGNTVSYLYIHPQQGEVDPDDYRPSPYTTTAFVIDARRGTGKEFHPPFEKQYFKKIVLSPDGEWLLGVTNLRFFLLGPLTGGKPRLIERPHLERDLSLFLYSPLLVDWGNQVVYDFPVPVTDLPHREVHFQKRQPPKPLAVPTDLNPEAVTISQDGLLIAVSEGAQAWVYQTRPIRRVFETERVYDGTWNTMFTLGSGPQIQRLAFSPNGKKLAVIRKNSLQIYDVPTGKLLSEDVIETTKSEDSVERSRALAWASANDLLAVRAEHAEVLRYYCVDALLSN